MIIGLCVGTLIMAALLLIFAFRGSPADKWQLDNVAVWSFIFMAGGAAIGKLVEVLS